MFNHSQSKHGVHGVGLSALNLTAGPLRKKAAVQTYIKHYWDIKIKQEVINKLAPTMESNLLDEANTRED